MGGINGRFIKIRDSSGGTPSASATIPAMTNTHALTDSTGGTASTSAIANLANGSTYATDHPTIENNFATIAAELALQRALNTAIINSIATLSKELSK